MEDRVQLGGYRDKENREEACACVCVCMCVCARETAGVTQHHQLDEPKWHKEGAGANQCVCLHVWDQVNLRTFTHVWVSACVNERRDQRHGSGTHHEPQPGCHTRPAPTQFPLLQWSTPPHYLERTDVCVCVRVCVSVCVSVAERCALMGQTKMGHCKIWAVSHLFFNLRKQHIRLKRRYVTSLRLLFGRAEVDFSSRIWELTQRARSWLLCFCPLLPCIIFLLHRFFPLLHNPPLLEDSDGIPSSSAAHFTGP